MSPTIPAKRSSACRSSVASSTCSARRLQTQERLTAQIVGAIDETLKPRGIAVMIEAEHQCMTLRGVHKHGASTVTTQFTGVFRDDPAEQLRFLTLIKRNAG